MVIWKFTLRGNTVHHGSKKRRKLTANGCNEPFKNRFWCPNKQWFMLEPCPFINQHECRNFQAMCGEKMGRI